MGSSVDRFMAQVIAKNRAQPEFHQAVREVVASVMPVVEATPAYRQLKVLERMVEPERVIIFRVPWTDDRGDVQINRGFRVEMNSAIGPYKGGLRFHSSVNLSILKFLAFEQVFKNSLTTLPIGGGHGGADFDPKGRSDLEVMRFCQSFMSELFRHIGPQTDVPEGDIGVGGREIGFLYGQYKKLRNEFSGVLTGKGLGWGGSLMGSEATGYGAVYFAEAMLNHKGDGLKGKTCAVSGSGSVARHAVEKVNDLGGKCVTLSDSEGTIVDPEGIDAEKLAWIKDLKRTHRRISEYAGHHHGAEHLAGQRPWAVPCDVALPCATQNEIDADDAQTLIDNGCKVVSEGANMPTVPEGIELYLQHKILYGPGTAASAGGVAISGLEISQNAAHIRWTREEVDAKLQLIMKAIHATCVEHGAEDDFVNYVRGANIGGFIRVADAMIDQGVV